MSSTIGSLLRVNQSHTQQICEKQTLEYGICFYATKFPNYDQANQFREVVLDDDVSLETVYQESQAWFAQHQLTCQRWAPAMGQNCDKLTPFLVEKGFTPQTYSAMQLTQWGELDEHDEVRIVPARAVRQKFRELVRQESQEESESAAALRVQAEELRMDDTTYDACIALADNKAVGRCSLYQVGDIACVMDFHVPHSSDSAAIEMSLLSHVLALAKRLVIGNICTQVELESPKMSLLQRAGFESQCEIVEFHRHSQL